VVTYTENKHRANFALGSGGSGAGEDKIKANQNYIYQFNYGGHVLAESLKVARETPWFQ
jgi:hypothetical protein